LIVYWELGEVEVAVVDITYKTASDLGQES